MELEHAQRIGAGTAVDHGAAHHDAAPGKTTLAHQASAGGEHAKPIPFMQLRDVPENVDLTRLNRHPGFDANRLGRAGGKPFATLRASHLFNSDGAIGGYGALVPAGAHVFINAGAITKLVCRDPQMRDVPPKPIECVYVFEYEHGGHVHSAGAWMPTTALPAIVASEQTALAQRIEHERGDAHRHFERGLPLRQGASPERDGVANLYTYPNQTGVQNKAKYYYGNLALNLPHTGGERVGVLSANIPAAPPEPSVHGMDPYREFYAEHPHREAVLPLFAEKSAHPTGKHLRFLYGYVKNDAGARLYGWINMSCLA